MLITVIVFALLSAILVAFQLRSHRAPPATSPRKCPRCGAAVPVEDASCPRCHAPFQAYDVVLAKIASELPAATGPAHPMVRTDVCVGCGTCVAACPETGALRLVEKIARVDPDLCRSHGSCAAACPVGAIVLTTGAAVQRVEVPDLDVHFQSSVPGVYVVGELGGRGLIKNAINEGRLAIEHVASVLRHASLPAVETPADHEVIIVGSGPAGLSAALAARQAGLQFIVLEQGSLSETIQRYPRRKLLFAEPAHIPLYGDLWIADATKESLLRVWQDAIDRFRLPVRTGTRVTEVVRDRELIRVRTDSAEFTARCVLLAMGRRGTPRKLGVPGEQLDNVFYEIVEMEAFAGQRVLVVGGGDSAIESAVGLSHQPETQVALSYRGADFDRAKERNRTKLADAVAAHRVRLLLGSVVREIRKGEVVLEWEGRSHHEPADVVIVRIGGDPPAPFLQRAGVRIVHKELAIAASAAG